MKILSLFIERYRRSFLVQILFTVVVVFCVEAIYEQVRAAGRWHEYIDKYGRGLMLPTSLNVPHATLEWHPGLKHEALTVRIFKPNSGDDDSLRSWITSNNHSSAFVPSYKTLKQPLGQWEATRGPETIQFYRMDEDGWITISVFERIPEKTTRI